MRKRTTGARVGAENRKPPASLVLPQSQPSPPGALESIENGDFNTLQEIVLAAKRNLKPMDWDHLTGGSDSETTIRRNRLAFETLALRQRVLVNVADVDITTTFLGQKLSMPVFVAPVGGFVARGHPMGAAAVVRAAEAAGTMAITGKAKPGFEATAKAARNPLIHQLYVDGDRKWLIDRLDRVKAAGYRALCVTVDRNWYARRERDLIVNFEKGPEALVDDPRFQASLDWDEVAWMKKYIQLPLILKGIATAEDAELAVRHGAAMVYLSNHGGRQLDQGEGTLDVLPEVVKAVNGKAEIVMDGGVLRGSDVVKALCLGARAVGVGKLTGYALGAGGQAGVTRMLELLAIEVRMTMGLIGATSLKDLNPSRVKHAAAVGWPTATSAYPWYEEQTRLLRK